MLTKEDLKAIDALIGKRTDPIITRQDELQKNQTDMKKKQEAYQKQLVKKLNHIIDFSDRQKSY
jgi:hypothetical protein